VKSCPTGCLHFGTKDDMVALANARVDQLKASGFAQAAVYDPQGVQGTTVVTVLAHGDRPEWYGLPRDPRVPGSVWFWKNILRPVGMVAMAAAIFGSIAHYLSYGPKKPKEGDEKPKGQGPV
jgi:formate dehydrogenase iron-sulfur subunit